MHAHICSSHELLLSPNAVSLRDRAIGVGQKSERKFIFRFKLFMGRFAVWRNTEHSDTLLLEYGKSIAKRAGLFGATGRVVFRIKIEHDLLPTKVFQADSFTIGIFGFECRCSGTLFNHVSSPS